MHNILHTSKAAMQGILYLKYKSLLSFIPHYKNRQLHPFSRPKTITLQFANHLLDTSHYQMIMG